jgi:predicted GNAT family N-acyltransferase
VNDTTISKSRDKFDLDFSEIHEVVTPAEVREFDQISARVRNREVQGAKYVSARVWRLSPLGVELLCDPNDSTLRKAAKVDLELTIAGQTSYFEGLVVDLVRENDEIALAGIRLSTPRAATSLDHDKRRSQRWLCSENFYPTCICPTPGRFNEYMYFQVRDISRDGFQLVCSLRNKYLIPGMELALTASFPMVGDLSVPVRVTRIGVKAEREKDLLVVGTEYLGLTSKATNVIGQYLLQFSNVETLSDLRQSGFAPVSVARATDFYFLKSESDYEEVLKLRLLAHQAGGTLGGCASAYDMSDRFDSSSRIIVAKHKGQIIASARVHFCALEDTLEHEQYFEWPQDFPRRDSVIEITRVCTHPNFRSNDLLISLLKFIGITCFQRQRPHVLVSSIDTLIPFYKKIGLQVTSITYQHPVYKGNQTVLRSNAFQFLNGKGVNPIYWNVIWREVYEYQHDAGALTPTPLDMARIRAYRFAYPIARLFAGTTGRPTRK